jgi:hypothetical protein
MVVTEALFYAVEADGRGRAANGRSRRDVAGSIRQGVDGATEHLHGRLRRDVGHLPCSISGRRGRVFVGRVDVGYNTLIGRGVWGRGRVTAGALGRARGGGRVGSHGDDGRELPRVSSAAVAERLPCWLTSRVAEQAAEKGHPRELEGGGRVQRRWRAGQK